MSNNGHPKVSSSNPMIAISLTLSAIFWLVVTILGVGYLRVSHDTHPRVRCFVGEEVVFSETFDSATQVDDVITATLGGITNTITPPTGGKCDIAR